MNAMNTTSRTDDVALIVGGGPGISASCARLFLANDIRVAIADACIDYKQHQDLKSLSQALKEACPDGIDGHFENVGGMILDAVSCINGQTSARLAIDSNPHR